MIASQLRRREVFCRNLEGNLETQPIHRVTIIIEIETHLKGEALALQTNLKMQGEFSNSIFPIVFILNLSD